MSNSANVLDRDSRAAISTGDVICTGPSRQPHFKVLAIRGDKAWVRDIANGSDHLALVARCRRVAG